MNSGAELLVNARFHHKRLSELPADLRPRNADEAYDCQRVVVDNLLRVYGGTPVGYKIACTNEIAQRQLRVDTPFFGRLLSAFCHESGVRVDPWKFFMRVIEPEFGFRMARDLPPNPDGAPYTREQVADAVEGVLPAIEIVDSRFDDWLTVGTPSLIADNACNAAWVKGAIVKDWKGIDLAAQPVRAEINGETRGTGSGAAVLGHPLNALVWLVNALNARGTHLRAGDLVTTGVTTNVFMAESGDHIRAEFGDIGSVEVTFT